MSTGHESLTEWVDRLRDAVNTPHNQTALSVDEKRWQQLCSSMDVLGDTTAAIEAYEDAPPASTLGLRYLLVYGVLQALFVQQDALKSAADAISFTYEFPQDLKRIRDIRTRAVGHPTSVKRKGNADSYGIMQVSLDHSGFMLYSFDWDKADVFESVRIADLIHQQITSVAGTLRDMVLALG